MLHQLKTFFPIAEKIEDRKSSISILRHICVDKGLMRVTDLEHSVSIPVDDDRRYTIPMAIMKKVMKAKPKNLAVDTPNEGKVKITFDGKSVTCPSPNPDDFPSELKEKFELVGVWTKEVFIKLYQQTVFTSSDILRQALTGIFVEQNSMLSSCATDGHALQQVKNLDPENKNQIHKYMTAIIPNKPILLLAKHAVGAVKVYLSDNNIRFVIGNGIELTSQLIDARYPEFDKVIPAKQDSSLQFNKSDMLKSIKDARPFANPITYKALFHVNNGSIRLSAENKDDESMFTTELKTDCNRGKKMTMAFNLDLLDRVVKGMDGDIITWKYTDENSACTFYEAEKDPADKVNLLMPIKLRE